MSWKDHSAKVQVKETDLPTSVPPQTGLTFNVWYNKWSQGQSGQERFVNPFRLEPQLDSGLTRGDKEGDSFFCLFFAKGMCCLGKKCQYMHHVPEEEDIMRLSLKTDVLDCFGREKFADYRDDLGGVGSFRKHNRTIYIGGLSGALNNKQLKPTQLEARIRFMFARLGEVDRIRYVESKNCAFVKYRHQCNAEFAKEAMSNQTLLIQSDKEWDDRKEGTGLLVKWANDDPDPAARKREEEEQKNEALKMMVNLVNKYDNDARLQEERAQNLLEKKRTLEEEENSGVIFSNVLLANLKKRRLAIKETSVTTSLNTAKPKEVEIVESRKSSATAPLVHYASSDDEDDE